MGGAELGAPRDRLSPHLSPFLPFFRRSASFSQATRSAFFMRSDTAVQKLSQGNGHCMNGVSGQLHGFYSLPKPSRHNSEFRDSAYDLPRAFGSYTHPKSSLTSSETDNEEVYTYKTPNNTLCKEFGELSTDSYDIPATPLSVYQIPRTFTLDKNHNALAVAASDSPATPPPRPPKPGQTEPRWGSPPQRPQPGESLGLTPMAATIPRRNTLPAVENSRLHRGEFGDGEKGVALSCLATLDRSVPLGCCRAGVGVGINQGTEHREALPGQDLALIFVCNGQGKESPGLCPLELLNWHLAVLCLEPKPQTCLSMQLFTRFW